MKLQETIVAQIHLAETRRVETTTFARSVITEMKGECSIVYFNEVCLAPQSCFSNCVSKGRVRIIIPLAGSLQLTQANEFYSLIPGGSVAVDHPYEIENTYLSHEIHFLEVDFQNDSTAVEAQLLNMNHRNELQSLVDFKSSGKLLIGKFDGRVDGNLSVDLNSENFVFIIGGVFEVQNRLLQERDGLWLKGVSQIEFEGLTQEGIILFLTKKI